VVAPLRVQRCRRGVDGEGHGAEARSAPGGEAWEAIDAAAAAGPAGRKPERTESTARVDARARGESRPLSDVRN
jgi:hypothetical protein